MESLFSWLAILISQQDSRHSFFYAYIYFCTLLLHCVITLLMVIKPITVDSIGQRNSYVKTWGCGGFLNETNIYSRGKSLCF
ncbi:hypothetical protein CG706_09265 [Escherichia coli]|uniref:Uncharacterized protein n=1 Tax=Escherichia coli TaxID=562 RepID=A0A2L0J3U2_ECOLX|nr:hypothetical protein C3F40_06550 [Escherichia coli]OZO54594.1 hypothetical protein CG706_09265 [Escherichia coli]